MTTDGLTNITATEMFDRIYAARGGVTTELLRALGARSLRRAAVLLDRMDTLIADDGVFFDKVSEGLVLQVAEAHLLLLSSVVTAESEWRDSP